MLRSFFSKNSKADKRLAEDIEILHNSPLVDAVWYRQTYPDFRDTPIDVARHYLERGAAEGRMLAAAFKLASLSCGAVDNV